MIKKLSALLVAVAVMLAPLASSLAAPNLGNTATPYFNSALSNTAVAVKATPGTLSGFTAYNSGNAVAFVQIIDATVANTTLGTTVPKQSFPVPSAGSASYNFSGDGKIGLYNAITTAATATATGSGAPNAALIVNLQYK